MTTATMTAEAIETTATNQATQDEGWVATPEWILAGKATWTVSNDKGQHYTFKTEKGKRSGAWFLSVLNGPDNENNYGPLGILRADGTVGNTQLAVNGRSLNDSKARKVAEWAIAIIWGRKSLPAGYAINHAGCCGACGKTLTRPEGVDPKGYRFGYGPKCWEGILKARLAPQQATAPTADERMAEAVARLEEKIARVNRAAIHPANRVMSAAERFARANRMAIEEQEEMHGANPMY